MNQNELLFFATPSEQVTWLEKILATEDAWCVAWRAQEGSMYRELQTGQISELAFTADEESSIQLYLGNRSIVAKPIWEKHGPGTHGDLDLIQSQAIDLLPSIVIEGNTLLLGQMSILKDRDYRENGINPQQVKSWFEVLSRSLTALRTSHATVVQRTPSGKIKRWEDIIVTEGAVDFNNSGNKLRQFPEGAVEFEIERLTD